MALVTQTFLGHYGLLPKKFFPTIKKIIFDQNKWDGPFDNLFSYVTIANAKISHLYQLPLAIDFAGTAFLAGFAAKLALVFLATELA